MLKKSIDFFVFSKIYVAIPVASLSIVSFLVFQQTVNWNIVLFTYFSTLSLYAFHQFWGIKHIKYSFSEGRVLWAKKNKKSLGGISAVSVLIAFYFLLQLNYAIWLIMLPLAVISIGYTLPILNAKRLRDLPSIKIYLISIVVTSVVVLLPAIDSTIVIWLVVKLFVVQFLFLFAITIPFDIRDLETDRLELKTIPLILGEKKAKQLAIAILLFTGILALFLLPYGVAFFITILIAATAIGFSSSKKSEYYFSVIIEGMMFIQCLFVYFFR